MGLTQIKSTRERRLHDAEMKAANLVPSSEAVEAAIARVLDAEHAAREAVAQAGEAAAAMLEEARAAARALGGRTERRIRAVRAAFEEHATAEVAVLDAAAAATSQERTLTPDEIARVEAAASALAAALTGSGT